MTERPTNPCNHPLSKIPCQSLQCLNFVWTVQMFSASERLFSFSPLHLWRVCFLHVVKYHTIYNFGGPLPFPISIKRSLKIKSLWLLLLTGFFFPRKSAHYNQSFWIQWIKIVSCSFLDTLLYIQPAGEAKAVIHT